MLGLYFITWFVIVNSLNNLLTVGVNVLFTLPRWKGNVPGFSLANSCGLDFGMLTFPTSFLWWSLLLSDIYLTLWNSSLLIMQYLITNFNDFQLACLGSFFLHESVFFLSGLPFIYLERAGWLSKYKIQVHPSRLSS